ncbi:MAG: hypothetical protein QG635_578 [Bacteroidota bacterium]|nr:hypothetical protein [Bacteroidota bacterium]
MLDNYHPRNFLKRKLLQRIFFLILMGNEKFEKGGQGGFKRFTHNLYPHKSKFTKLLDFF